MMSTFWPFVLIFLNISYGFTQGDVIISSSSKVVAGERSVQPHIPYVVSVVPVLISGQGEACTGAIITDQWVLTAAHCLDEDEVSVHAGVMGSLSSQDRRSKHVVNTGDVALLHLSEPFTINEHVRPITLAKKPLPTLPMTCVAIGYGSIAQAGHNSSSYLVSLPTSAGDYNYCNTKHPSRVVGEEYVCLVPDDDSQPMSSSNTEGLLVCSGLLVGVQLGAQNEDGEVVDGCVGGTCTQVYMFAGHSEAWIRQHVHDLPELQILPGASMRHVNPEYLQLPPLNPNEPCLTCEILETNIKPFDAAKAKKCESDLGCTIEEGDIKFTLWAPGYGGCPGPKCKKSPGTTATRSNPNGGGLGCSPIAKLLMVGVLMNCLHQIFMCAGLFKSMI